MLADLVVVLLMVVCVALIGYASRSLHRQARGLEAHAHADGTVHSHHRGSVPHAHRLRYGDPLPLRVRHQDH
jgi:hypothetical protein